MYVRVRDKRTGHELDVLSTDKRIGDVFQPVSKASYPDSPYPRAAKHNPLPSTVKNVPVSKATPKPGIASGSDG